MIKQFIILILLSLSGFHLHAQEPVLDRDVEEEREEVELDRTKVHLRFGLNLGFDKDPNLSTKWNSFSFKYGGVALFRAADFYSFGITYGVGVDNFRIKQDTLNLLSPGFKNDKQSLILYTGRLGIRNRFHLGKHGVKEGVYLEIGAEGSIRITSRMRIQNDLDPKLAGNQAAEEVDALYRRLKFTELIGYYGTAAFGRNGTSIYGEYRLSNLFKKYESVNNNERLPNVAPLNLGIRFEL